MLSILLLTCYRLEKTMACLKSIRENTAGTFEVILTDNGSPAEEQGKLRSLGEKLPWLNVELLPENVGRCEGLKRTLERSVGEYVAFLDNDMIVTKDWDARAIERLELVEGAGCVGFRVIEEGRIRCLYRNIMEPEHKFDHSLDNILAEDKRAKVEKEVDLVHDGAVVYKREALEGIEFPGYFLALEGLDLILQVRQKGYKILTSVIDIFHFPCVRREQDPTYFDFRRKKQQGYREESTKIFVQRWGLEP